MRADMGGRGESEESRFKRWRLGIEAAGVRCWMFDVGCSMFAERHEVAVAAPAGPADAVVLAAAAIDAGGGGGLLGPIDSGAGALLGELGGDGADLEVGHGSER